MIALACDHGGFELMKNVKDHLSSIGLKYNDFGTYSAESCDYPVFAIPAAKAVAQGVCDRGIFICTTGIGISMVANKIPGIRAALCTNCFMAEMTRKHNDANILALGAGVVDNDLAIKIIDTFLNTDFSGEEKHSRRIKMLLELDGI